MKYYIIFFALTLSVPLMSQNGCPEPYNGSYKCVWGNSNVTHTEGQMSQGKRVGLWKTYWHTGKIHTKTNYRTGEFHGTREVWNDDGVKESISEWSMGERTYEKNFYDNGKVKHVKRWNLNGDKHGIQLIYEAEGSYRKSNYQNGELLSWQAYNNSGQLISDEKNLGDGKVWSKYYHVSGKLSGEGLNIGTSRQGEWNHYYENGQLNYTANYFKGMKNGPMKLYHENGELAMEGSYDVMTYGREMPIGEHIYYHPNGKLQRKQRYNEKGLMVGQFEEYYDNGQIRVKTNFSNDGMQEGTSTEYYPNGQVGRTGNFIKHLQDGNWQVYFENGKVSQEISYQEGKIMEFAQYNTQGEKYDTGTLANGTGTLKTYDQNGSLAQEVEFVDGKPKGQ